MLDGTAWRLVRFSDLGPPVEGDVTLNFDGGRVYGDAGCNRYEATFESPRRRELVFGPAIATRRACDPAVMDVESAYLDALSSVLQWNYLAGRLALLYPAADGGVASLIFGAEVSRRARSSATATCYTARPRTRSPWGPIVRRRIFATLLLISFSSSALAAVVPAKPHHEVVEEVVAFLMSDVGVGGVRTEDAAPDGATVPPYFYHYAIQHDDELESATVGYPGYASISYPGYTMAIAIDAFLAWWAYSGDPEGLARAIACADWLIDRRTPADDLYANWVYSTQTDGVMGGGYDLDAVMSDKSAMFALRLLRLHDVTGDLALLGRRDRNRRDLP